MKSYLLFCLYSLITFSTAGQIVSENVNFTHGACTFKATLTKPSGPGPFKTIVLVPGSGQNDRNGTITMVGANVNCLYPNLVGNTLTIYEDLATYLTDSGFAVLRYDELTVSCPNFNSVLSYSQLFLPAYSALDYLKTRSDVDSTNLILMGHSEGAALIPYMASKRNDIKALVSLAGARTPLDSLLAFQTIDITRKCNGDTNTAKTQAQQILAYFDNVRTGNYNTGTPSFGGVTPQVWKKYFQINDSVALLYQHSNLPSLLIGLEEDINVPPSELIRFQNELTGNFSFYSLPNLIHYMTTPDDPKVSRQLADTIVYWLKEKRIDLKEESSGDNQISFYPNPFKNQVTLVFKEPINMITLKIEITNTLGQKVWNGNPIQQNSPQEIVLPLSDLIPGIYYVFLNTGTEQYSYKIQRN